MKNAVLAALLVLIACSVSPLDTGTVYELTVTYVFVNNSRQEVTLRLDSSIVRLYLVPEIEGWQALESYRVVIDGADLTGIFHVVRDEEGNRLIVSDRALRLEPGSNHSVALVQRIVVYPPWARTVRMLPADAQREAPKDLLYTGGYWSSPVLDRIAKELIARASGDPREYVIEVIKWVAENIEYRMSKEGGIASPHETVKRGWWACGERSGVVTALLRRGGIGSYLMLAYYYEEREQPLKLSGGDVEVVYVNALPHVFSMCHMGGYEFPIDTTLPLTSPDTPLTAVNKAIVNTSDRLIIVARFVGAKPYSNLNTMLEIYAPAPSVKVRVVTSLKILKKAEIPLTGVIPLLLVLAALTLYVLSSRKT